jgi:hypothetical protein
MKALLLILALTISVSAQTDWKLIKEMSGEIPDHPGLTAEFYAAEIARGDSLVKLLIRMDFPWGAPKFPKATYPTGFDASSISRFEFKVEFNCDTLVMKPVNGSSEVYQFNGKRHKSKEPPFPLDAGHVFVTYFCERGEAPTKAPTLKP